MNIITINGKTYTGDNITIIGDKVFIDGSPVESPADSKTIKIEIKGNTASILVDGSLVVYGDVNGNINASGNVSCGNVHGNIDARGNVIADSVIDGNIKAGGNVIIKFRFNDEYFVEGIVK